MKEPARTLYFSILESPCGPLLLLVDGDGAVIRIEFAKGRSRREMEDVAAERHSAVASEDRTARVRQQLEEYFAGHRTDFDLELAPEGTEFQREVWHQLLRIPYGETTSYGTLSAAIGRPNASRAVGAANGANPIPILVPCHRVIGSNGALTGFGGGLEAKKLLLELEGVPVSAGEQKTLDLG